MQSNSAVNFPTAISPSLPVSTSLSNTEFLRRCARRMLNDVHSTHPSQALPAVRRLHTANVLPAVRLTDLYRQRNAIRLKHVLHAIAAELGYANWTDCKREVDRRPATLLDRFRMDIGAYGDYNKLWFADEGAARDWQLQNGGHVVVYGKQAAVVVG